METILISELIDQIAPSFDLEPSLVYGVCKQESNLSPYAVRYEKKYKWTLPKAKRPNNCSLITETILQKTSIGLMQVMGAVYRELGYTGWLTEIVAYPDIQLEYGCSFLAKKIARYGLDEGILAYNSGSPRKTNGKYINQYYLDKVKFYEKEWENIKWKY